MLALRDGLELLIARLSFCGRSHLAKYAYGDADEVVRTCRYDRRHRWLPQPSRNGEPVGVYGVKQQQAHNCGTDPPNPSTKQNCREKEGEALLPHNRFEP